MPQFDVLTINGKVVTPYWIADVTYNLETKSVSLKFSVCDLIFPEDKRITIGYGPDIEHLHIQEFSILEIYMSFDDLPKYTVESVGKPIEDRIENFFWVKQK